MILDEILTSQKRGEVRGIPSICSAHPWVLKAAMQHARGPVLIEATCNQVNQFGGYTGMTPADFFRYARELAVKNHFPRKNLILGGDHLGPSPWQNLPASQAMDRAEELVRAFVEAGFTKIHLDCSMPLSDDPAGALDLEISAQRSARLAMAAQSSHRENLHYVIGTEVPVPGGATGQHEGVHVTTVHDAQATIEATHSAFLRLGLEKAWQRVIALVVQPGIEFGDDFVLPYKPEAASELSRFIEDKPMVYEAHSTDYQTREALRKLVRDHFAILKVGPALTFAFREAIFALAMIENELLPPEQRSNLIQVLDHAMLKNPVHWRRYYHGNDIDLALKRKYSLSDRIRYYWSEPEIQHAMMILLRQVDLQTTSTGLLKQFLPDIYDKLRQIEGPIKPKHVIQEKIRLILDDYAFA